MATFGFHLLNHEKEDNETCIFGKIIVIFLIMVKFGRWGYFWILSPHMTCQPKSVDKMADFETLTLCNSQTAMCVDYLFCKDLFTGYYCLYQVKNLIHNHHPFLN